MSDTLVTGPTFNFVSIFNEFSIVFHEELLNILRDSVIDFEIDSILDIQPFTIISYHIDSANLKEKW